MKIGKKKRVEVEAKTLKLHLKVTDGFTARLLDQHGVEIIDYEGYVPKFMPGQHYGDYVMLDIDMDTGCVTNWKPNAADVQAFVDEHGTEQEEE